MQKYLRLGNMELVPDEELNKQDVYYIPHHAVFHNGKIRVVFNASMPSSNGLSLNASLYTGRKLQTDIVLVLIRWRFHKYVFTSDIVKMNRQFLVHPLDRDWLRIIYDFGRGIHHFRLSKITYGTGPAPYQSLRGLWQIVKDLIHPFAHLRKKILKLFYDSSYIDDFFAGAETLGQIIDLCDALIKILADAKIEMVCQWPQSTRKFMECWPWR